MKIKSKNGNQYEVEFEKTVLTTQTFERDYIVNKISEIQNNIDASIADKAKYEEILVLIDSK